MVSCCSNTNINVITIVCYHIKFLILATQTLVSYSRKRKIVQKNSSCRSRIIRWPKRLISWIRYMWIFFNLFLWTRKLTKPGLRDITVHIISKLQSPTSKKTPLGPGSSFHTFLYLLVCPKNIFQMFQDVLNGFVWFFFPWDFVA